MEKAHNSRKKLPRIERGAPARQFSVARLFRWVIVVGGLLLAAGLFYSTQMLVEEVRDSARGYLTRTVEIYRDLLLRGDASLAYDAVQGIDFPMVLTDEEFYPLSWKNIDVPKEADSVEVVRLLTKQIRDFQEQGNVPISVEILPGQINYFHYGDPTLVRLLRSLSFTSAIVIAVYIFLGYIGYRSIREAETRSVWVGMARETAHQLGTPISSLLGWLEVIDSSDDKTRASAIDAMRQDVTRLEKIAVRFSKIGASEKLQIMPVEEVVNDAVRYMRTRVGTSVSMEVVNEGVGEAALQSELIGWVLENLLRNAAQAMGGEGRIRLRLHANSEGICVDVVDEGVGIAPRDREAIFRPGFTTKKRGWGLGLSLSRRIVQEMHHGRLYVHDSRSGEGTTIRMVLPR